MLSSPPGSPLVLPKAGRDKGGAHQQVADLDQPLQPGGPRLPTAPLAMPSRPTGFPLPAAPGVQRGGQLGLRSPAVGPAHDAAPHLALAEEVAVRAALCPGHVYPSV